MDLCLDGKRAIVLASSSGLGLASARELAREGATVAISSRSERNLDVAKDRLVEETGVDRSKVTPVVCDLSVRSRVPLAIEEAVDALGGLDVLVTNTGGPQKLDFDAATVDDFDRAYDTILRCIIAAIEAALPPLLEGGGALTHIVAATAPEPEANHVVANTIRPSVYGLSKSLSREYANAGLRSNCVCPRKVGPKPGGSDVLSHHVQEYADAHGLDYDEASDAYVKEVIPLGRRGSLDEFGKTVAFLSSDAAGFVTGETLAVDGGWTRRAF